MLIDMRISLSPYNHVFMRFYDARYNFAEILLQLFYRWNNYDIRYLQNELRRHDWILLFYRDISN